MCARAGITAGDHIDEDQCVTVIFVDHQRFVVRHIREIKRVVGADLVEKQGRSLNQCNLPRDRRPAGEQMLDKTKTIAG